jgi:hypothetical protein
MAFLRSVFKVNLTLKFASSFASVKNDESPNYWFEVLFYDISYDVSTLSYSLVGTL